MSNATPEALLVAAVAVAILFGGLVVMAVLGFKGAARRRRDRPPTYPRGDSTTERAIGI